LKPASSFAATEWIRVKSLACFFLASLGVIIKFWLITPLEIIDEADDPHEYVLQILFPANGGLAYPPGTGLVGRFFHELGIPFHLGIEAVFILASALVLRALLGWPWKSYLSVGLFLFTIFNPVPEVLFMRLMSDQVWLVETMLGISWLVLSLEGGVQEKPRWLYLGFAAGFLGLSSVTRSTFIPLIASLLIFTLIMLLVFAFGFKSSPRQAKINLLVSLLTVLLATTTIYYGTCYLNSKRYGYFGLSAIDCSEYRHFYTCLQSVGPAGKDTYFPVDQSRRQLIATAGPTAKWFVGEVDKNEMYQQVGRDHYGKSDVPSGWFHFATFNVLFNSSDGDLRKSYSLMRKIENEIAEASSRGDLSTRFVLPLPDSRLDLVWVAFPLGWRDAVDMMLLCPPPELFSWEKRKGLYNSPEFAAALLRQQVQPSPAQESAWRFLCTIYAHLYGKVAFYLYLALTFFSLIALSYRRDRIKNDAFALLAQQAFAVFFFVHMLWYAFFDASGLYVFSRYMIFQNVMLPILIVACTFTIVRLLKPTKL
jgi:hypothetical protein